jgi:hypothetical protein
MWHRFGGEASQAVIEKKEKPAKWQMHLCGSQSPDWDGSEKKSPRRSIKASRASR